MYIHNGKEILVRDYYDKVIIASSCKITALNALTQTVSIQGNNLIITIS